VPVQELSVYRDTVEPRSALPTIDGVRLLLGEAGTLAVNTGALGACEGAMRELRAIATELSIAAIINIVPADIRKIRITIKRVSGMRLSDSLMYPI
jgi:hypothetical protein